MRKHNQRFITSPTERSRTNVELVTVVLLSEKAGYRMKSYGPTPLLKIGGRLLIDLQIDAIKSVFRNFELIICCGFDSEKIIKHIRSKYQRDNIRVVENQLHQHSNCCESMRLSLNNTSNNRVLVCNGSLIFNKDLLTLVDYKQSHIISANPDSNSLEIGFTANNEGVLENLSYGIENIWAETFFLHNEEMVDCLRGIVSGIDYKNKFAFEALNHLNSSSRHRLAVVDGSHRGRLTKLDNIKTYHAVRRYYESTSTKLRN